MIFEEFVDTDEESGEETDEVEIFSEDKETIETIGYLEFKEIRDVVKFAETIDFEDIEEPISVLFDTEKFDELFVIFIPLFLGWVEFKL